jgi:hypothetical protein
MRALMLAMAMQESTHMDVRERDASKDDHTDKAAKATIFNLSVVSAPDEHRTVTACKPELQLQYVGRQSCAARKRARSSGGNNQYSLTAPATQLVYHQHAGKDTTPQSVERVAASLTASAWPWWDVLVIAYRL